MLGDAFGHRFESSVENKAVKISKSKQALLKKRGHRNVHSKPNKASGNINKSSCKPPLATHEESKPAQSKPATNKQVTGFIAVFCACAFPFWTKNEKNPFCLWLVGQCIYYAAI